MATAAPRYCYRHPDRETGLSCSECDRPICYECMTPAPVGLRCPEHSGKPQGMQKVTTPARRAVTGTGSTNPYLVTMTLIAINVGVYFVELARGSSEDGTGNSIYNHGALVANGVYHNGVLYSIPLHEVVRGYTMVGVAHGEWWRLITSAFLHYGLLHLGVNMLSLYFVGRILEQVIGRWRYVLLYLASGVIGSAGALLVTPNDASAGASGAIFGVLGALFVLERMGVIMSGGQILMWIILNLAFTFGFAGISIGAHVGGLAGGVVLMILYRRFGRSAPLTIASTVGLVALSVAVAYARI